MTTTVLIGHLLLVNVAAGAPIMCVWLEWRGDGLARRAATYLGQMAFLTLIAGGLLGGLVAWLRWTPAYRDLWTGPLAYKLQWGVAEFVFSLVMALVYWALVSRREATSAGARSVRAAIAFLNGTNLLYHFPSLFVVAGKLHDAGRTGEATIYGAAFRRLIWAGEIPAVTIHVTLASVAMAGVMLLGLALWWIRRDVEPADVAKVATWGGRWALVASLLQLPIGLWTLVALPSEVQSRLMGNEALATLLFLTAMLSALWLVRELAVVSLGEVTRASLARAITAMLVVVGLMTAMQQQVRPTVAAAASPTTAIEAQSGAISWPRKS